MLLHLEREILMTTPVTKLTTPAELLGELDQKFYSNSNRCRTSVLNLFRDEFGRTGFIYELGWGWGEDARYKRAILYTNFSHESINLPNSQVMVTVADFIEVFSAATEVQFANNDLEKALIELILGIQVPAEVIDFHRGEGYIITNHVAANSLHLYKI